MARHLFFSLKAASILTILTLLVLQVSSAQVRSSANYQLERDSINAGGGLSASSNYSSESTVGDIATGDSTSNNFRLQAGYQQLEEVNISLSVPTNIIMTDSLGGITGGESNGSTTVTVTTDSAGGYQLTIQSENDPAMQSIGPNVIADYVPNTAPADQLFTTDSGEVHFGFTTTGVDIADTYNFGVSCGTGPFVGAVESLFCWNGLTTIPEVVAQGSGRNNPSGATTTFHFKVGIANDAPTIPVGMYTATTTLTAYPL